MKKLLFFSALFFSAISVPLFSEETEGPEYNYTADIRNFISQHGDLPFDRIEITGLRRTAEFIILRDARIKKGSPLSSFQCDDFVNRLKKRGLFSDITLSYAEEDGKAVIHLSMKEKMSFIPVPLVMSHDDSTSYGFMVMDSNFLGTTKFLLAGFLVSSDDFSFFSMYRDPSIAGSRFTGQMILSWRSSEEKRVGQHQIPMNEFSIKKTDAGLFGGYVFTDGIEFLAGGGISDGKIDKNYKDMLNPPENCRFLYASVSLKADNLRYGRYLSYGFTGKTSFSRYFSKDSRYEHFNDLGTSVRYSFTLFGDDRISLTGEGNFFSKPVIYENKIGGRTGAACLPSKTSTADRNLSYSLEYEYAISFLKFSWGAATILGFWEQGIYERDSTGWMDYLGPGCGTRIYLKKVAFPAVGFNYSWNLKNGGTEFSFSLGIGM